MTEKSLICVNCPMGCRITAIIENDQVTETKGNRCPKGKEYAMTECIRPERILTTTVRIYGALHRVLPVITTKAIPLDLMMEAMKEIRRIEVDAPVKEGDILLKGILGTDADVAASKTMDVFG